MADTPGNDPKPTGAKPADAKPEVKSGAVKPPVLDLKARESGASTGADKPEAKPADTTATAKPRPADKPVTTTAQQRGFPFAATLAGGVLGLAAAYGLAWFGLWPAAPAVAPPADPRLASFATAIPELETVTQTTQAELATLNQRIGALETAEPAAAATTAEPVDLSTIEADIAALTQRIDSVSAPPADTGVDALRTELAALDARLAELAARLGTAEAGLRDLDTTVTETSATLASQPSDIGAVLQLPLILSGFETAFATGRPFETELSALRAAVPDAAIPTAIANNAATGLTRPDIIASRFAEVLPAMLAGRPVDATEQWQDGALDWFRSAIALRPTGEIEGDNPEAVMSRLEGAIARRDFTTAETLLASLPEPMLSAAGDVPALVASQAEAARFLDTLRASALSGEAMQ
ncbi:MAG: hypothetical protein KJ944_03870 [Alphaproteobacteria bacterium]|nr:hypothetical protein [Alphaproteobacteria bacterium]MBU1562014.1 hypothetical protein [Alphaproteobacteria bacterium]MBU2301715.1 hypothetical protein [Alphaproteobacteria bacterium]MBU2369871.1 hypothetical protein [Alphaproteobacteria bacterium]